MDLQYRQTDYFNSSDYYIIKTNLGWYVSQCHYYNGSWFSNLGLQVKMTSILSISFCEIYAAEIKYKNTTLKGKVVKDLDNSLGIIWNQGGEYRKYGMPNYWNNLENLELC